MGFIPEMETTHHLRCYHVGGLSLDKNTETILLGGFGDCFEKHALEEHKFSLFNHHALQERMWKGCGKREAGQSRITGQLLALCRSFLLILVMLEGNALRQNVT